MTQPPAEIAIDERLVRGLLVGQRPDLADLPLSRLATLRRALSSDPG